MILQHRHRARGGFLQPKASGGFTLIELLAVMTIILILAGLILSIAGNANYKAAQSRAQGEVQALSVACESYKTDNGAYPRITSAQSGGTASTTDTLDARTQYDPASGSPTYSSTSMALYQLLCGSYSFNSSGQLGLVSSGTLPTAYYTFTDSQLTNSGGITSGYISPATVTAISDPFGFSYGYSTIYQYDVDQNTANGTTTPPANGYNPTFDLWSTAGYSPTAGKTYPTPPTSTTAANFDNTLWVKNW